MAVTWIDSEMILKSRRERREAISRCCPQVAHGLQSIHCIAHVESPRSHAAGSYFPAKRSAHRRSFVRADRVQRGNRIPFAKLEEAKVSYLQIESYWLEIKSNTLWTRFGKV